MWPVAEMEYYNWNESFCLIYKSVFVKMFVFSSISLACYITSIKKMPMVNIFVWDIKKKVPKETLSPYHKFVMLCMRDSYVMVGKNMIWLNM